MPLVSDVQVGAGATGNSASPSAPLPTSVLAGDSLTFIAVTENPLAVTTNPAGWGSPAYADDTRGGAGIRIWSKIAGASETAPSAVYASAGNWAAIVVRVRGGDLPSQFTGGTAPFPPTTPSIDPTAAGSLKFGVLYVDPTIGIVAQTWASPTTTLANVLAGSGGINGSLSVAVKAEDTAGSLVGNQNWQASCGAVAFAVAPAAPTTGLVKRWDGAAWQTATVKRWDGTAWQTATAKRWDGAAWQ